MFNIQACTRHNNVIMVAPEKLAQKVTVLAAVPMRNVTAYDGCFPKTKQFYFADKNPPNNSCQRTC